MRTSFMQSPSRSRSRLLPPGVPARALRRQRERNWNSETQHPKKLCWRVELLPGNGASAPATHRTLGGRRFVIQCIQEDVASLSLRSVSQGPGTSRPAFFHPIPKCSEISGSVLAHRCKSSAAILESSRLNPSRHGYYSRTPVAARRLRGAGGDCRGMVGERGCQPPLPCRSMRPSATSDGRLN